MQWRRWGRLICCSCFSFQLACFRVKEACRKFLLFNMDTHTNKSIPCNEKGHSQGAPGAPSAGMVTSIAALRCFLTVLQRTLASGSTGEKWRKLLLYAQVTYGKECQYTVFILDFLHSILKCLEYLFYGITTHS